MLARSTWSTMLLSSAVLASASFLAPAFAQEATPVAPAASAPAVAAPAAAPAAAAPEVATAPAVDPKLKGLADDFLHYSIVGNEQLAKDSGQAILAASVQPRDILQAFEAGANERDFRKILATNQRVEGIKDISKTLLEKVEQGYRDVARDPERIKADIERLDNSPRAYNNARDHLLASGAFATPYYIQYLQDSKKSSLHPYILRVMGEVGRPLLPPLLQQLQTPNQAEKLLLVNVIGAIGYPQSVPYLKALAADASISPDVKKAADIALARSDDRGTMTKLSPAEAFYQLGLQYYQKRMSTPLPYPTEPTNPVWYYNKELNNVIAVPVPTAIWNAVEALRACEMTLKLDPKMGQAISLWLAADFRRELALPADAKDPTKVAGSMDAGYYAMAAGPVYVNPVLLMAINDRDAALILKSIAALEATGGTQGLVANTQGGTPLVQALGYPDRAVRFNAAFALARANPAQAYPGHFRVVPVLAEAISQTGAPNALVVDPNQDNRNRLKAALAQGTPAFTVYDGPTLSAALENARKAAAFDVVLIPATGELNHLQDLARSDYRLTPAPVLVMAPKADLASVKLQIGQAKGFKEIAADTDEKGILEALSAIKTDIGQTAIDQKGADAFAMTAIKLLGTLAGDHASIYSANEAVPTLIEVLKDKRPEVLTAAAGVLGQLNNADAQKALAAAALADNADTAQRVVLFNALAESAKRTGNVLDAAAIEKLIKIVTTEADAGVKNAAATALGALNVPANQAAPLILQQIAK